MKRDIDVDPPSALEPVLAQMNSVAAQPNDSAARQTGSDIPQQALVCEAACSLVVSAVRQRLRDCRRRRGIQLRQQIENMEAHLQLRGVVRIMQVFQADPWLPWTQDPIAQEAIQACEEAIAERRKVGDCWPFGAGSATWAPVVQEWEAHQELNRIQPGRRERIPESVLRGIVAGHYRIAPENVTREQLRIAGAELCCHYGQVLMIPLDLEGPPPPQAAPHYPTADASFFKEREDEFLKHDSPLNSKLALTWSSVGTEVHFRMDHASTALRLAAEQVFKSLARETAKGLGGTRSRESWLDWTEAVRRAVDPSTGQRLFARVTGNYDSVLGERELERLRSLGEPIPEGGLVEFVIEECEEQGYGPTNLPYAEMRLFWEGTEETIEDLFACSANACLEFRSRIPGPNGQLLHLLSRVPDPNHRPPPEEGGVGSDVSVAGEESPSGKGSSTKRRRGPKPNYDLASRVAKIVATVAPDWNWRPKLDDVCIELDDEEIPRPKTWTKNHGFGSWLEAAGDDTSRGRHKAVEAISHHLNLSKVAPSETPS